MRLHPCWILHPWRMASLRCPINSTDVLQAIRDSQCELAADNTTLKVIMCAWGFFETMKDTNWATAHSIGPVTCRH